MVTEDAGGLDVRLGSTLLELCDLSLKRPPEKMAGVGRGWHRRPRRMWASSVGPLAWLPAAQVTEGCRPTHKGPRLCPQGSQSAGLGVGASQSSGERGSWLPAVQHPPACTGAPGATLWGLRCWVAPFLGPYPRKAGPASLPGQGRSEEPFRGFSGHTWEHGTSPQQHSSSQMCSGRPHNYRGRGAGRSP